jgi:hypothetical protein
VRFLLFPDLPRFHFFFSHLNFFSSFLFAFLSCFSHFPYHYKTRHLRLFLFGLFFMIFRVSFHLCIERLAGLLFYFWVLLLSYIHIVVFFLFPWNLHIIFVIICFFLSKSSFDCTLFLINVSLMKYSSLQPVTYDYLIFSLCVICFLLWIWIYIKIIL